LSRNFGVALCLHSIEISVEMPRVKSVRSLSKICVDFILDNENYFHKKVGMGSPDLEDNTSSPFEHLRKLVIFVLPCKVFVLIHQFQPQLCWKN
jgi:hypothetical protein